MEHPVQDAWSSVRARVASVVLVFVIVGGALHVSMAGWYLPHVALIVTMMGAFLTVVATAGVLPGASDSVNQVVGIVGAVIMAIGLVIALLAVLYPPEILFRKSL